MRSPDIAYLALILLQAGTVAGQFPRCPAKPDDTGVNSFISAPWTNRFGFYGKHCTDQCKTLFQKGLQSAWIPLNKVSFCQADKSEAVVRVTWNFVRNSQARYLTCVDICRCDYEISITQLVPPNKCDRSQIFTIMSDSMEHGSNGGYPGECVTKDLYRTNGQQFLLYYSG